MKPNRRLQLENQVFNVYFENVEEPGQPPIPNYLVVSPKHRVGNVTGVAVLPFYGSGTELRVGLIELYRFPASSLGWEMPKGFIDSGETLEEAILRELKEELNLTVTADQIELLGKVFPEPGLLDAEVALYSAKLEGPPKNVFEPNEVGHRRFVFFSPTEFEKILFTEVRDATTLAGVLQFLRQNLGGTS